MGLYLMNNYLSRFNTFSGSCRLLNSRYSVLFNDDRGIKQSINEKLNIPDKPKRPLTPFLKFMKQVRPSLVSEKPGISIGEVSKKVAEKWQGVDHKVRLELEVQYHKEKELYNKAKIDYLESLTDEQKSALEKDKQKTKELKTKRKLKQKAKEFEKPKKPLSSFVSFSMSRLKDRGDTPLPQWLQTVSKDWQSMDQSEKDKFIKRFKEEQVEYNKQLAKWEEKMISLGHVDLVRTDSLVQKPKSKSKK